MLNTPSIVQIPSSNPAVYAFRVRGEVTSEDMEAMAKVMNDAFDTHDKVSMLLRFEHYEGAELGASWTVETMKSQFRSLANVDKYAVVGAPALAATMISVMDKVIPVDARSFDAAEEAAAWDFVAARPLV